MDELFRKAKEKTKRAFEVIEELNLFDRWSRCGRPSLVGSVTFGLVVARDIDLDIISKEPKIEQGFEVASELAALPGVLKVRYTNRLETVDQGLYWQIHYEDQYGDTWTVDNWLVPEDNPHSPYLETLVERMRKALSTEQRRVILEIKESTYPDPEVRGIDIYEAVMEHGVQSPEGFAEWLGGGKRVEISQWLPRVESGH